MSEIDLHKNAFRRAIIAGDDKVAEEARRFLLREYKREGLDYGTALSLAQKARSEAIDARDASPITNFYKGVGSGAVGLGETAALGIAALQEEENELKTREKILNFFGDYKPSGYDEEAITSKVGSGIGSIAALAPAAAIAATPLGAAGALGTAGTISLAAGAGEASERARASGATQEERNTAALLGTLVGASEVLPLGRVFKAFEIAPLNKLIKVADPKVVQSAKDRVVNAGKTGTLEGLQEFGAAVAQNAIERGYNPEQVLVDYQTAEEGGIGAAAGAIFQGVIDTVVPGRRSKPDVKPEGTSEQTQPKAQPKATPVVPADDPDGELSRIADEVAGEDVGRMMADVPDEVLAGEPTQLDMFNNRAQQEEIIDPDTNDEMARIVESLSQQDDQFTQQEFGRRNRQEQPDMFVEQRRERERAENDAANSPLVSGEQPDMFARERGQDLAQNLQRRGQQSKQQETENEARTQEQELEALFAQEDADYQQELDFMQGQPSRGQMDMFLEGTDSAPDIQVNTVRRVPTKPSQQRETRPEAPTNETVPQTQLDFEAAPAPAPTAGVNPPRNQQRRVRKELARGQEQRGQKQREARATRRAKNKQALRDKVRAALSGEDIQQSGEQATLPTPLIQAGRGGINEQQAQQVTDTPPANTSQTQAVPTQEGPTETVETPLKDGKVKPKTKAKPKTNQKPDVKKATSKPVTTKTTKKKPGATTKSTPSAKPAAKPETKKERRAERNVKSERIGPKNKVVKAPEQKPSLEQKVKAVNKSTNAALSKYIAASNGNTDVLVDSIAMDILSKEPRRQLDTGEPRGNERGAKRIYDFDGDETKIPTDRKLSGTGQDAAKKALTAMKQDGSKDMSDLAAQVEKRMKDRDIVKRAEMNRKGIGKTKDAVINEISTLQQSIARTEAKLDDVQAKADVLKGKKYKDFYEASVKPVEATLDSLRTKMRQKRKEIKNLPIEALMESAQGLTTKARYALMGNNLIQAMDAILDMVDSPRLKSIVKKLAKNTGTTKVVVMDNLTASDGTDVAGYFDAKENTIYLDSVDGMNVHTVLHETLHAVTSATLANKQNSTAKRINKIFEDVKDKLDTAYGAKNVDEFVAEAFSNPDFQRMLSRIRPDGSPMSAWQSLINNIGNMVRKLFGLDAKPVDSTMSKLDHLVMSIIHPAPTTRPAGELFMVADAVNALKSKTARALDPIVNTANSKSERRKWINKVTDFVKEAPESVTNIFNKVLQMQGLADLAQHYDVGDRIGHRMLEAFNKQRGNQEVMDQTIQAKLKSIGRNYDKLSDGQRELLNTFIYDEDFGATISQVDIKKPKSDYKDPDQQDSYDDLKKVWAKMDAPAKRVYDDMKAFYEAQRKEVETALVKRIEEAVEKSGSAQKASVRDKLIKKLIDDNKLAVYFPLMREGDYVVSFSIKDEDGNDVYSIRQFDGSSEAKLFTDMLKENPNYVDGSIKEGRRSNEPATIRDVPPTSFMYDILKQMEENGVPQEAINDVVDIYTNTLPEASILKGYKRRENTIGFLKDANYALNRKGYQAGAQIIRLQSVQEVGQLMSELNNLADKGNTKFQTQIIEELKKRGEFVLNGAKFKGFEELVKTLNQGAFVFTIGFNTASALVNLSQVPMVSFPMLGGKFGFNKSRKALIEASGIVAGSRAVQQEDSTFGKVAANLSIAHGIDKYFDIRREDGEIKIDLRKDLDLPESRISQLKNIKDLVLEAKVQGQLTSSFLAEALGLEEGGKKTESGVFNKFTGLSAGMFSQAERYNRQVTLIASYNLKYDELLSKYKQEMGHIKAVGQARKEATAFAIEETQRLNGGSTLETASGLSQQNIGRIAMMYKNYGVQMYTMMFQTARQAVKDIYSGDPVLQSAALRQIVGLHGSALFFSGVYGMPLYGSVALAYDALVAEDDEEDFDTIVQSYMGQGMFRGGLNAALEMAGVDVDAGVRMRMTDLIMQENRFNPNPSPEERLGTLFGGVALSIGKRVGRGINDVSEGNYQRGIEQLVPASITNIMKPFRYEEDGGIRTRRGDLIHDDLSAGELAAQAIGFAPEEYLRQQEQNRRVKNIDEAINSKASSLTKKYYVASRFNDVQGMLEAYREILKFNQRNPKFALTPERIQRSLKGHLRTTETMYNGVSISKRMQEYLQGQNEDLLGTIIAPNR